jgi:GNAT superfamily N-acetyltransferase
MRDSLARLGRFDEDRARERFRRAFRPVETRLILVEDGVLAGCVTFASAGEAMAIDNFYLFPERQGRGLGSAILDALLAEADAAGLPVRLGVLRERGANRFYMRRGFEVIGEEEWDINYERPPAPRDTAAAPPA